MANTTYTVKKGDTLTAIAKKYSTTVKKLAALNDIDKPYRIHVGQKLTISGTAPRLELNSSVYSPIPIEQCLSHGNTIENMLILIKLNGIIQPEMEYDSLVTIQRRLVKLVFITHRQMLKQLFSK